MRGLHWAGLVTAVGLLTALGVGVWLQQNSSSAIAFQEEEAAGTEHRPPDAEAVRRGEARTGGNRLAAEASPYLQLHAHNPVDWYPWGEEAFARARAEDRPVFLSIGYSTCYWCHVMEREVFSNPDIAALMNARFVNIKVDREERPDIDAIYMDACHMLARSCGWPNSVFLTPEGEPFYAGTYFPPQDRPGRPGFPSVLGRIHEVWSQDRQRIVGLAHRVAERISLSANLGTLGERGALPPVAELVSKGREQLARSYEPEHGGFSRGTKFPRAPALALLLPVGAAASDPAALRMLTHTLDEMALGGIYDQLAGGFHRYATEPTWSVPHFEKMLYDNGQLLTIYARAYAVTHRALYRRVVEETAAYLDREMSHPDGGFHSAQDAEVEGQEGATYVWSRSEIEGTLGLERGAAFLKTYELVPTRDNPAFGVLRVRLPGAGLEGNAEVDKLTKRLAGFREERRLLLGRRAKRPQPLRDDKVLGAWNGLVIRGLVEAAEALGRRDYVKRAERAAHFVLARLLAPDGTLHRSYIAGQVREDGVLNDYAFLADGLLALYGATHEARWLEAARKLADTMLTRFQDEANGGFYLTPTSSRLLIRPKPFDDNALPSGNGVAVRVLRTLGALEGGKRYQNAAERTVSATGPLLERAPSALPTLLEALNRKPPSPRVLTARSTPPSTGSPRLPRSEDHVEATAAPAEDDASQLVLHLAIDSGWHVNANPASMPFLVPTEVQFDGASGKIAARYPAGRELRPAFAREPIQVYQGEIDILVQVANGDPPKQLALRVQACDESRCLPPSKLSVPVTLSERRSGHR